MLAEVLGMPGDEVDEYITILTEIADASGGGLTNPSQSVGDCPDWEDNRILDLAEAVGAFLIVSDDTDLIAMSPWRGRPIISPDRSPRRSMPLAEPLGATVDDDAPLRQRPAD